MSTTSEGLKVYNDLLRSGKKPPENYMCFACHKPLIPPAPYFAKLDIEDLVSFYPVCKECAEEGKNG
jgi:hypothetical protein